jgi:hypothetical protein
MEGLTALFLAGAVATLAGAVAALARTVGMLVQRKKRS